MFVGLEAKASSWTDTIDLGPFFFRLTIDSATEFLFGESINSQSAAVESQVSLSPDSSTWNWSSLAECFDRGTAALGVRARLGSMYWLHDPALFRKDCSEIHQFADHCVSQALNRKKAAASDHGAERYIFLDELVKTTTDPIELRSQLLNVLLAGRDTTAGLLGWIFWCLARHPAVLRKLRTTILDDFGTYEEPRSLSFSTLKSSTYLQQVIKETLRLFPSVPINARQATKNTTLPVGGGPDGSAPIYVRAGQEVSYSVYVMHRRKDIWGADAEDFNPDRWAGRKVGWEYLPFNGGPRLCLGQQFALTEVGYVLVRMLQRFDDVRNCDNSDVTLHQYSVTTAPKKVWVQLHRTVRCEGLT
ncbi:MAG: hypothetical protein M1823_006481 [Watsoniomyces obsoletus]|nr:MAG: hypothetical protein M1823_006481 [Watsoniomyces obsoletus]